MINEYLLSWESFRKACEDKAKNRAVINTSGWKKLLDFHLDYHLKSIENPYLFLLTIKWKYPDIFYKNRMSKYYNYYARNRIEFNPLIQNIHLISFPTWKK